MLVGKEQHSACFKILCIHPDYASSHIEKNLIFVAHRIFSSSILCVMTSTDSIIDTVVICMYDYLSTSQPP